MLIVRKLSAACRHRAVAGLLGDRRGSTAVEYTIIAGLLSIAIIASFGVLSGSLTSALTTIGDRLGLN